MKKIRKARNPVVRKMIDQGQRAGPHTNKKKEQSKYKAREPVDEEEIEEPFHPREIPNPPEITSDDEIEDTK
jgi:hypothetical protein